MAVSFVWACMANLETYNSLQRITKVDRTYKITNATMKSMFMKSR